jgi:hypothetical protein
VARPVLVLPLRWSGGELIDSFNSFSFPVNCSNL